MTGTHNTHRMNQDEVSRLKSFIATTAGLFREIEFGDPDNDAALASISPLSDVDPLFVYTGAYAARARRGA